MVAASFIGTTIEWYDFFLYGTAAALVFGELFFPGSSPLIGTLVSLRHVRRRLRRPPAGRHRLRSLRRPHRPQGDARACRCMIMGVATFLIGCLPTHASIGIVAPILLVLLRFAQGIGVGGEWGGAVLMSVEQRPEGQARPLRRLPADGRAGRPAALDGGLHRGAERHHRGPVHGLGLARPVPGLDRARRGRPVRPPGAHGVAGVQGGQGQRRPRSTSRSSTSSRPTSATC